MPEVSTLVTLTPTAQEEARRLLREDGRPRLGLRLGVKGGGCSGLAYRLDFDEPHEGDLIVAFDGIRVLLDPKSAIYLRGVTLDHEKGLGGRGFVFKNPNARNSCGCGESFAV